MIEHLRSRAAYERSKISKQPVWVDSGRDEPEEQHQAVITMAGKRMRRKRKRDRNARRFWEIRLRTGAEYFPLINDALENAPAIVETARAETVARLHHFAKVYPERCLPVTD